MLPVPSYVTEVPQGSVQVSRSFLLAMALVPVFFANRSAASWEFSD
ncbi:hypothetical protein [Promicromonospora sp. NPDC023805]